MAIDYRRARSLLQELNLRDLFVAELNWANPERGPFSVEAGGERYDVLPVAQQGSAYVFEVQARAGDGIPDLNRRKAIHRKIESQAYEHLLVYVNEPRAATLWSWPRREEGKPVRPNEHRFHRQQPGDSLLQRLEGLAFSYDDLDDEGKATIVQVSDKLRAAFATNAERVTKRFYDEFQKQHAAFLKFIDGIERMDDRRWYASVMLNRLMFIYFVQKKGFLDGNPAYLAERLKGCKSKGVPYFRGFLVPLFFEGFATKPDERSPEAQELLGDIPYLNGGLFMPHQIEQASCGPDVPVTGETIAIDIPDKAFERIFGFFDQYHWHLDDRPLRADNEINPDVLGYIFEKYINQKQMGAYYTKEDITGYITRNTVIPFLFDRLERLLKPSRPDALSPLLRPHPPTPSPKRRGGEGTQRVMGAADAAKVAFAREQRKAPTESERALWNRLRGQRLGTKFRRQHPIGDFVLDFYCESAGLAVEIDGPLHAEQADYDEWRDGQLAGLGIRVLRIRDENVAANIKAVLNRIRDALALPPLPSGDVPPLRPGQAGRPLHRGEDVPPLRPGEGAGGEATAASPIEPYIYDAVRKGVHLPLPENIAAGLDDVSKRTDWNRAADTEFALPTETWREHIARRQRYRRILDDFAAGRIASINDFITYNLDIVQFAQDFVADADDPYIILRFYECLKQVTILDPTCGSGAFLFAALNLLESLYELCLQRMEEFLRRRQRHPDWATPFEMELEALARHPSPSYFI